MIYIVDVHISTCIALMLSKCFSNTRFKHIAGLKIIQKAYFICNLTGYELFKGLSQWATELRWIHVSIVM